MTDDSLFRISLTACVLAMTGCGSVPPTQVQPPQQSGLTVCPILHSPDTNKCSVIPGTSGYVMIAGQVLAPDTIYQNGGILIAPDGTIEKVGCDAVTAASTLQANQIVCPSGVISPGLINAHDHITYDWNKPSNWGDVRYDRRNEWRKKSSDLPPIAPSPTYGTDEQTAWSELRQVLSGTTSIAGSGGHKGFLRNLDKAALLEGLSTDYVYYNTFPLGDTKDVTPHVGDCNYPKIDDPAVVFAHQCYLPHMAEGIDLAANNEIQCMEQHALISHKGAYIHSIAAFGKDGEMLKEKGASIVWSPRSNISLYGNTAQVSMYSRLGMNISLSSDWTPSGSMNLLRELKCADSFNRNYLNGTFSDRDIWLMVTANPADALKFDKQIGRLTPGLVADIAVYDGSAADNPYRAVLNAEVSDVLLVLRGGSPLYGDSNLFSSITGWASGCEPLPDGIKGIDKNVCIQREIGESFATLLANNASSYPLFFDGSPPDEPTCSPSRPAISGKESGYSGIKTAADSDGDGIPNAQDNCPSIFNPIRPMDGEKQADCNGNGVGDVCDPVSCN